MEPLQIAVIGYGANEGAALDGLLAGVAARLQSHGLRLAGAVQRNTHNGDRCRCDMTLEDLTTGKLVGISEHRGENARGCRLDQAKLEEIVGLALSSVESGADLLIVNKFGKRESEGHGFRAAIEAAIDAGIPVLASVSDANSAGWNDFVQGLDVVLAADEDAIMRWCLTCTGYSAEGATTEQPEATVAA